MSELFDELARSLAAPMPRRRALRVLGGTLVMAAVPGALRPAVAHARQAGSTVTTACNPNCTGDRPVKCVCPAKGGCFIGGCGEPGSTCCCFEESNAGIPGAVVCPPGYSCGGGKGKPNCICNQPCGITCCKPGQFCANRAENLCCKRGQRRCGLECCRENEECRTTRVGTSSLDVCTRRCPSNRAWCGRNKCCPPRWKCINESTGLCKRCWPNEEQCNERCCDRRTSRCCGAAGCCPKNRSCCVTGGTQKCCPAGEKCAVPILAGDIGIRPRTPSICCPAERLHKDPTLCCPPGQVALQGPGLSVGPGLSPFCCPRSRMCNGKCCQTGLTGTETCCNGQCVDMQFNLQNCGRCGRPCIGTQRCVDGVCVA